MKSVVITGWKSGLKKISLAKIIHEETEGSIFDARRIVEKVLNGEPVLINVSDERVEKFIENSEGVGAILKIIEDVKIGEKK